jgi:DNA-binding MarR family transcriptional regulator/N-acetylglutamate synthase-like GNAT family acetyltransferase
MTLTSNSNFIESLGVMALGSRLKRLLECLNNDITRFYESLGVDFKARWFAVLYLLGTRSPLPITQIAQRIGLTHPAVNKIVAEMTETGLVQSTRYELDKRKRLVDLTRKGRNLVKDLTPVWDGGQVVVTDLLRESGHDFLGAIAAIEKLLEERSLYSRLVSQMQMKLMAEIEIIDYSPSLKEHFKKLNYLWLHSELEVEPYDEEVLSDPQGQIIARGGVVLFAALNGKIVGTCALMKHADGSYEACKMAVAENARRRYVGTKLTESIITKAREMGANALYVETDPERTHIIHFCEHFGFEKIPHSPLPSRYKRPCVTLVLNLAAQDTVGD